MGAMTTVRFASVETSIGLVWLAETEVGVAAASRSEMPDELLGGLRRRFPGLAAVAADLDAGWMVGGAPPGLDLRGLSTFDARVYRAVVAVPPGETRTYGEIAALIGSPGAARAVGGAMARCPLFPAVPCHRVVRASDGWSGWGGDARLKRRLQDAERRGGPGIVGRRRAAPRTTAVRD